ARPLIAEGMDSRDAADLRDRDPVAKAKALAECGHLYVRGNHFDKAIIAYDAALELNYYDASWMLARAECLLKLGQGARAVDGFTRYIEALEKQRVKTAPPAKA